MKQRVRLMVAGIVVLLAGMTTIAGPVAAQQVASRGTPDPGIVRGPVSVGYPPPTPAGRPAPTGVDPATWKLLQAKWRNLSIWRKVYFGAYPNLFPDVTVHHAIERQVLKDYPRLFTAQELNSLDNLRGIPVGQVDDKMHKSLIRKLWDEFYRRYPPKVATKQDFYRWRAYVDVRLTGFFLDQAGSFTDTQAKRRYAAVRALGEAAFNPDNQPINSFPGFRAPKPAAPGSATRSSGLTQAISTAVSRPGGIDFSTLQLRYLSDTVSSSGRHSIGYAFTGRQSSGPSVEGLDQGTASIRSASDSFFVWLALPRTSFWVNLNPNEPDRIIDVEFGRTDAGRILLEADLQLKKTVARLIHPDTARGKAFWNGLQGAQKCLSMRQWIVPAPATVRATGEELYILDAPLQVKMETEYLQDKGNTHYRSCPKESAPIEAHNEALYTQMILPQVQRAVNEAPEYAALRQVYLSRVAAEWMRQRSRAGNSPYHGIVDSGNIRRWVSQSEWTPRVTFDKYVTSYTKGEFNIRRTTRQGSTIYTHTYVFGGVDFTRIPERTLDAKDFAKHWAGLSNTVDTSESRVVAASGGHQIWAGGRTVVAGPNSTPKKGLGTFSVVRMIVTPAIILMLVVGAIVRLRRRAARKAT